MKDTCDEAGARDSNPAVTWVTDETFSRFISSSDLAVVYFWADMPVATHTFDPIFNAVADKRIDKVSFGRLDVDENPLTAAIHDILSIPTLIVFRDGEVVGRLVGATSPERLEADLELYLG